MRHEDRASLRRALKREDAHHDNAEFHAAMHALADLLPSWVDRLALNADATARDASTALAALRSRQPLANDTPPNRTE